MNLQAVIILHKFQITNNCSITPTLTPILALATIPNPNPNPKPFEGTNT